ncbi:MAG: c-type cytochrome [Chlamydiae bacterium]|nr:c-type cytochrome [Chlamydiota bacterium]MBI3266760.1 c-type cytochrome [Chlamydiota bacterium]
MISTLNQWRKKPTEEQSYRLLFFAVVAALVLLTLWAIWDETFSRRPWKEYQKAFFRLELGKVQEEYNLEEKNFDSSEIQKKYQDLREKSKALKEGPQDLAQRKAYQDAKTQLEEFKFKLQDLSRESQVAKSEYDAAYYRYEKANIEGDSAEREEYKQKVDALQNEMNQKAAAIQALEKESQPLWDLVKAHDEEVSTVQNDLASMTSKLEALQKKISDVKAKSPKIQQIVITSLNSVDRCQTCHLAIDRPGFEDPQKYPQPFRTHPQLDVLLKKHPLEKFACTSCHGGQGPALTVQTAHGEVHHWEHPLLRGKKVESSCVKCHATVQVPKAPQITQGKVLFGKLGCSGCHVAPAFEEAKKVGPELSDIHQKTTLEWMARWIENPHALSPTTRMPQFKVTPDESKAIAHYLGSLSEPQSMTEEESALLAKGSSETGKQWVTDLACIACHKIGEDGNTFAPNLSWIGSKARPEWLMRWLKDPRGYLPHGKMPNMRLTDQNIADLVSYLTTLKEPGHENPPSEEAVDPVLAQKGLQWVGGFGCFGCHDIKGMEGRPRVGADLTSFGSKDLDLLYFGYAKGIPHTLWDWAFNKIKNPQVYATERIEQKMPNFHLSNEEANSIVTLLTSFSETNKDVPMDARKNLTAKEQDIEIGRNLVRDLNCVGCHVIEGQGGTIAPNLTGEGAKVQPEWLFGFLKNPIAIRPWLAVRMPRFNLSDEDATHLVNYFSALSDAKYPYESSEGEVPERERKAGQKLFEMFKCMSCHPVSLDASAKGNQVVNLGPNLGLAKDRLRHEWIAKWILGPEELQPGTKMPTNFPKMGDKRISFVPNLLKSAQFEDTKKFFEDLLGPDLDAFLADPALQTQAIRDYLISFKPEEVQPNTEPAQPKPEVSQSPTQASQNQTSPQPKSESSQDF